jgi:hypothetical protein
VPQPSEDVVLYYPGRKLVERIRQYGAHSSSGSRSNLDKAIGIIHHRVHPLHPPRRASLSTLASDLTRWAPD